MHAVEFDKVLSLAFVVQLQDLEQEKSSLIIQKDDANRMLGIRGELRCTQILSSMRMLNIGFFCLIL
jgi:hypothetical protein